MLPANGNFLQSAFFGSRLWEFAAGMSLGLLLRRERERTLGWLLSAPGIVASVVLYTAGFLTHRPGFSFTCTDGLLGTGLSARLVHLRRGLLALRGAIRAPLRDSSAP